jgi:RND family efflux transporter MFP subunit
MSVDDRLSDLLVEWEQGRRSGAEPSLEELCRDTPELLPVVRESIDSLRATDWMFQRQPSEPSASQASSANSTRAAMHDTELPASHLTAQEFAASIFQSGLLSRTEINELKERLDASALPGEAREIASRLVTEGKLTRYQAAVLLKASKDPLLVDNYVILDTLDTGGMGLVFKALHRSMNRVVALKLLPASMMSARDTVKRFQREVQAAAALKHPNIVAAYDADESDEIAYLVLEYVEGTNLFRLVKEEGPRTLAQAANYVRQAATGLAYLHSRGIIHRDVKPANLILANDGTVKLLDMGLVRFASSEDLSCCEMDQELTQAGIVIGTVAYMSPEQALDTRSADQRSDIYSLGCTLFFLLTGRSLYHEETGMKTLLAHREQPIPSIREFCEEAPVSLDAIFRTMVAKRPADRLQSMEEVIAAIEACVPEAALAGRATDHGSFGNVIATSGKLNRAHRGRRVVTAAALAGLAVLLAVIIIRIKSESGTTEIHINDPDAEVSIETQPSDSRVGKRQVFRPPSRKQADVDLGEFTVVRPDPKGLKRVRFHLLASTSVSYKTELEGLARYTRREALRESVNATIKNADEDDFRTPRIEVLQSVLSDEVRKAVQRAFIRKVVIAGLETTYEPRGKNAKSDDQTDRAHFKASEKEVKSIPVVTVTVRKGDFKVYLSLLGNVVASQTVTIRPRVDGEIIKVYFKEGQIVHAGDPLFDIDFRPYQTRLEEERAQFQRDEASFAQAAKALERGRKLEKTNSITPPALDALVAARDQAKGAILRDEARLKDAMLQLGFCTIKAPITGRIGLRIVERGNVVRAAGDTKLAEIVQVQPIDVAFPIPQDELEAIQRRLSSGKETTVEILRRDLDAPMATGKLTGLDNAIDASAGTLQAKARIANEDNRLYPGQFVGVRLLVDTLHDVVIVPTSAVQHGPTETFAFVVKPDQTVEKRKLVTGGRENEETVVTSGLSPGEIIVVKGTDKLIDGSKVELSTPKVGAANVDRKAADSAIQSTVVGGTVSSEKAEPTPSSAVSSAADAPNRSRLAKPDVRNDAVKRDAGRKTQVAAGQSQTTKPRNTSELSLPGNWPSEEEVLARMNAESSDDRAIAQWVHAFHGEFGVQEGSKYFHANEGIPEGDFHIFRIFITDRPEPAVTGSGPIGINRVPLPGAVVSRLAKLTSLKRLDLDCRACTDATLRAIGRHLQGLVNLGLHHASITDAGLESLSELKHLRALDLSNSSITDKGLEELIKIRVFAEAHDEAPAKPWMRPAPPILWLDGTKTTEAGIVAFQKSVPNCEISAAHLMEVHVDRLNSPYVPAPVPPAPGSTDRVWAQWLLRLLNGCSIRTDVDPDTVVTAAESLPPIDFHITRIGFSGPVDTQGAPSVHLNAVILRRLSDLSYLEAVSFDPPSDAWIPAVATLTRLKSLSLQSADRLGDDALKPIGGMIGLTSLWIQSNRLTDGTLKDFSRLKALETLFLSRARYMHGSGLKDLGELKRLKTLGLDDSGLDDNGLSYVAQFPELERLILSGTWISDAGLSQLTRLPHLKNLDLSHCRRIDDSGFQSLLKCKGLQELNLSGTRVTVESIPSAREQLRDCSIQWSDTVQQKQANAMIMREVLERHRHKKTPKGQ